LFLQELLESELRLRTGGLGGVDDFDTWSVKLETSEDVSTMVSECLDDIFRSDGEVYLCWNQ
jgi:hypothetical protein